MIKSKQQNVFKYIAVKKTALWIKRSREYRFNLLMGPIRASKDYNATIAFIETVKKADYDMFMIGAVDVKNAMRIIGRYILNYLGGLAKRTTYMEAPAISFPYNGMTKIIIFAGGKNQNSDMGIQGLTLHSIYLTEINMLDSEFVDQAIKRTSSFEDAKIFGTFNPRGTRHPFMIRHLNIWKKYQDEHPDKKWLNFETLKLFDNPILTEEMIEDIKASYDPNSVSYKRDILGLITDPEGAVYRINDKTILDEFNPLRYTDYITVADMGETRSGTAFLAGGIGYDPSLKQKELHILKEYIHLNLPLNELQRLSQTQYAGEYAHFIKDCIKIFNAGPSIIYYDGDTDFAKDLRISLAKLGLGNIPIKFIPDKSTEVERINLGTSWLYTGKLRIYKECKNTIEDLRNSQYDEKAYEARGVMQRLSIFDPDTGHNDLLDALDYLMLHYRRFLN